MPLHVYSTLHKAKQKFDPITAGVVNMFVCGPTVYDLCHVGNAKTYTHFDFIARYLRHHGYTLTYLQNITDVDDKIIKRAHETDTEPSELASKYTQMYLEDMTALHNTNVDRYAPAHDHIDDIVRQIQTLIERGHAYQLADGWYFDLTTFPSYGKLSGRTHVLAEDSVSRIDENPHKRNPGDFVLWKIRKAGEPYWDTPLGSGRPGWHIEDTAITEAAFGPQYDLHCGAADLIFPHHEAEVAQMEAASGLEPLARYWLHGGLLRMGGTKMSKSLGNIANARQVLHGTGYRTLRYVFLSQHYRSAMEFSETAIDAARAARHRVEQFARTLDHQRPSISEERAALRETRDQFFERLDDDFDTPGALAVLFTFIRYANKQATPTGQETWQFLNEVDSLFDTFELSKPGSVHAQHSEPDDIAEQVRRRSQLRVNGKYAEADAIRQQLLAQGIVLEDTPDGTRWWRDDPR